MKYTYTRIRKLYGELYAAHLSLFILLVAFIGVTVAQVAIIGTIPMLWASLVALLTLGYTPLFAFLVLGSDMGVRTHFLQGLRKGFPLGSRGITYFVLIILFAGLFISGRVTVMWIYIDTDAALFAETFKEGALLAGLSLFYMIFLMGIGIYVRVRRRGLKKLHEEALDALMV